MKITQHLLSIETEPSRPLPWQSGAVLGRAILPPWRISQVVTPTEKGKAIWQVCLLGEQNDEEWSSLFCRGEKISGSFPEADVVITDHHSLCLSGTPEILQQAEEWMPDSVFTLRFITPALFGQEESGEVTPALLLQNLTETWNACSTDSQLRDKDAEMAIIHGLSVESNTLQSGMYTVNGESLEGFTGEMHIRARLAPPLLQIVRLVLFFANYSGVGLHCDKGFGGVQIQTRPRVLTRWKFE